MCTQNQAISIMHEVYNACNPIFGVHLKDGYLYCAYARGDYHSESNIDILLTGDMAPEEICRYWRAVTEVTSDLSLKHDITILVGVKAKTQFEKYANDLPYYQNVLREEIRYGGMSIPS